MLSPLITYKTTWLTVKCLTVLWLGICAALPLHGQNYLKTKQLDSFAAHQVRVNSNEALKRIDGWIDSLELQPHHPLWHRMQLHKAEALNVIGEYTPAYQLVQLVRVKYSEYHLNDPHVLYRCAFLSGRCHQSLDDRGAAMDSTKNALSTAIKYQLHEDRVEALVNMAEILRPTSAIFKTIGHLEDALNLCKIHRLGSKSFALVHDRYAACSFQPEDRKYHLVEAMRHAKLANDDHTYASSLLQYAHHLAKDSTERDSLYLHAGKILSQVGDKRNMALAWLNYSLVQISYNSYPIALTYLNRIDSVNNGAAWPYLMYRVWQAKAEVYQFLEQKDSVIYYKDKAYQAIIDSYQKSTLGKLYFQQSRFDEAKQDARIREQELVLQQQNSRLRWTIAASIAGIAFAIILSIFIIRLRRRKNAITLKNKKMQVMNNDLQAMLKQNTILLNETHHRVKNNLQVVVNILGSQIKQADSQKLKSELRSTQTRLKSMGYLHNLIYSGNDYSNIEIQSYLENLTKVVLDIHVLEDVFKTTVRAKDVYLPLQKALHLGILVNEWLTNTCKHALEKGKVLSINLLLMDKGDHYLLEYHDNGPGLIDGLDTSRDGSIGFYLIKSMSKQLKGKLDYRYNNGAEFKLPFEK